MKRDFFFVFYVWGILYIGLVYFSTLPYLRFVAPAFISAYFAFWLEGRVFHEED